VPAVAEGTNVVVGVCFVVGIVVVVVVGDIRDEKVGFGFRGLLVFV